MNVFRRIGDIISSNVNSALDKMENPEKMIDLSIKELENSTIEMKSIHAEKTAELRTFEKTLENTRASVSRWEERARLAAQKGEDDMAREAIEEKIRLTSKANRLEETISELKSILASLEESRIQAQERLDDMRIKSSEMKARAKSAQEKKKLADITNTNENAKYERRLAEINAKIEKWEAYSEDSTPLYKSEKSHKSYEELEREDAIEKELAKLKEASNN